ncbi:LOW QUALITY PROTEIN: complement C4 [Oryzias latipes]|uniref:LOW QUALITY PROTEIN: complement C4 n=1 Tax=Oryzias latipes TaxID=8090 RepID=UPI000CE26946|nr:LOW QUALITY PROTEIN: complement C4 [Oryzias latipes]
MQSSCTMKGCTVLSLLLLLKVTLSTQDRFFISAPTIFHVGVKEKVFVQIEGENGQDCVPVNLWLEHEQLGIFSNTAHVGCTGNKEPKLVELMINSERWLALPKNQKHSPPYLNLLAQSQVDGKGPQRKTTKVLVSEQRGYIFIQTDQPIYNPTQKVKYRIFTLDHSFRPYNEPIVISIYNAAGNRILKSLRFEKGGIYRDAFSIPSVSKMGTWKVTAHYENDEGKAAEREFKVEQFVMPSFDVNISLEKKYILLTDEHLNFTISAMYSYGETVKGAYHCQFGVVQKKGKGETNNEEITPRLIKGLEQANSVHNGSAEVSLSLERINSKLQEKLNLTLSKLVEKKLQLFVGVFVTNVQSGEIQEAKVYLPVFFKKYSVDFSRTRSHFVYGYPLDVVVDVSFPDGSPAPNVPVKIEVRDGESMELTTDEDGTVIAPFSLKNSQRVMFKVTADGQLENKIIHRSSRRDNYLYITYTNKVYYVREHFKVTFNTLNAAVDGNIYYMILSRGNIISTGVVPLGVSVPTILQITAAMVPLFRLVGYYYNENGDIIADSILVNVKDECEIDVKVQTEQQTMPGTITYLDFDLHGQTAQVALLSVDKAIYALNADNKLTAQQVFATMESHDLGCTYGGGKDSKSILDEAGLAFFSQSMEEWRKTDCRLQTGRSRRSIDLQQEMNTLKSGYKDPELQSCCAQAFSLIPMKRTCRERAARVRLVGGSEACAAAFEKCCKETEILRRRKILGEGQSGFGRSATNNDIEEFFKDSTNQYIRRYFPPSFAFTDFEVNNKKRYDLALPDSITTWEIQVVTFSPTSGLCVVKPQEIKAFKRSFVSLRLPYSVKRYEQLSVTPVIYNYHDKELKVAVHMEQTEGLCSPASATQGSFVTTVVKPHSSQSVSFSAVPMVTGSIPIKIRLFDIDSELGIDAQQKSLLVKTEGAENRQEETQVIHLDGNSTRTLYINGTLPDNTVPESSSNIFISMEGNGFCTSQVSNLLNPEKVSKRIGLYLGCLEQTMSALAPTVLAMRYLDLSQQWFTLKPGARDVALSHIEQGYMRILTFKNERTGSYSPWEYAPYSTWVTALVVKMLSLITERQSTAVGPNSQLLKVVPQKEITEPVEFLLSLQNSDGTFDDQHLMIHRYTLTETNQDIAITAFITLALNRSLQFLSDELQTNVKTNISKAIEYLQLQLENITHPYAMAITSYCLSTCPSEERNHMAAWEKLQSMVKEAANDGYFWSDDPNMANKKRANGITIQTTAYALLTAVKVENREWADKIAHWLIRQENYNGGFRATHDTILALEALSEYELKKSECPEANIEAEFSVTGKNQVVQLTMKDNKEKVETEMKSLTGNIITVQLKGIGDIKFKTVKAFHMLDPEDDCTDVSISVTVEGKVEYTAEILENYDYGDYEETEKDSARVSRSVDNWFDSHTRGRRDHENDLNAAKVVTYKVCVSHSSTRNLTGMSIADITLLSGFEAKKEDLEKLKRPPEQYITHYELINGKVVIYFNELFEKKECIAFDAEQLVPVGLLQPAEAVFYDYYEPERKCRTFYSAPKRNRMISKICSEDVCQCAERPCYKVKERFKSHGSKKIKKIDRVEHACFYPVVDYAYIVTVNSVSLKSNFELYKANIANVLKSSGDLLVKKENSVRVFAKRLQCKGQLEVGNQYLIMGKDGSTTDTDGKMQYLLESDTWVEKMPSAEDCQKSFNKNNCKQFKEFIEEYKINGCTQ